MIDEIVNNAIVQGVDVPKAKSVYMDENNRNWAENYTECPTVNYALTPETNFTSNITFGLRVLGAVETDFTCAGYCRNSTFFTFSNLTYGAPHSHCHESITEYVSDMTTAVAATMWTSSALTLGAFIYLALLLTRKDNHLTEPLLGDK